MKRLCVSLSILAVLLLGVSCGSSGPSAPLTVSAAVSLKDAFNEIAGVYKTRTGREINFNFGASGALEKQIESGTPADVFASAGESQMQDLIGKKLVDKEASRNFARNTLVLIVPANSQVQIAEFGDLANPAISKIAVGDPKTVPAGQYAAQTLERLSLTTTLQPRLVTAEDVRQVLDYVVRGEVDAGIVYATDAKIAGDKVRIVAEAREETHDPILYPIAVVTGSPKADAAKQFVDMVTGPDGQAILQKYGFATALR